MAINIKGLLHSLLVVLHVHAWSGSDLFFVLVVVGLHYAVLELSYAFPTNSTDSASFLCYSRFLSPTQIPVVVLLSPRRCPRLFINYHHSTRSLPQHSSFFLSSPVSPVQRELCRDGQKYMHIEMPHTLPQSIALPPVPIQVSVPRMQSRRMSYVGEWVHSLYFTPFYSILSCPQWVGRLNHIGVGGAWVVDYCRDTQPLMMQTERGANSRHASRLWTDSV